MKKRNGFVSNSSSSSFCILGTVVDQDWFTEEELDKLEDYNMYEILDEKLRVQDGNLSYVCGISDYYEEYLVGRTPDELEEDKTIKELKKEIAAEIKAIFKLDEEPEVYFHVDGGYDG